MSRDEPVEARCGRPPTGPTTPPTRSSRLDVRDVRDEPPATTRMAVATGQASREGESSQSAAVAELATARRSLTTSRTTSVEEPVTVAEQTPHITDQTQVDPPESAEQEAQEPGRDRSSAVGRSSRRFQPRRPPKRSSSTSAELRGAEDAEASTRTPMPTAPGCQGAERGRGRGAGRGWCWPGCPAASSSGPSWSSPRWSGATTRSRRPSTCARAPRTPRRRGRRRGRRRDGRPAGRGRPQAAPAQARPALTRSPAPRGRD